jgi:teichuronic acid biosynthesis glycosyltransferase TuaG
MAEPFNTDRMLSPAGDDIVANGSACVRPLISVVTPCLNGAKFLARALESVQNQSFQDWEHLIVDDGSSDGSDTIALSCALADSRIVPLKTRGRTGAAATRNVGLAAARGRYVAFLDSDDWWDPRKLELQLAAMRSSGAAFCVSPYIVCRFDGLPIRIQPFIGPLTAYRCLKKQCVVGCLTVMIDVEQLGPLRFREQVRLAEDFVLWVELLRRCEREGLGAIAMASPLAYYRVHEGGQSRSKFRHAMAVWRAYSRELTLPLPRALHYFISYLFHGLFDRAPGRHRIGPAQGIPELASPVDAHQGRVDGSAASLGGSNRISPVGTAAACPAPGQVGDP